MAELAGLDLERSAEVEEASRLASEAQRRVPSAPWADEPQEDRAEQEFEQAT